MKKIICCLVLLIVWPVVSYSAPDETAKFLMNDKVSMMDWGLKELEDYLEVGVVFNVQATILTSYDWDKNRIYITAIYAVRKLPEDFFTISEDPIKARKEIVAYIFKSIRGVIGFDKNGALFSGSSFLENFFTHNGYRSTNETENLGKKIDSITELRANITLPSNYETAFLKCYSPLLSSELFCNEPVKKEEPK